MTLEEYTDEELALLPKHFREQLLHSIPVVDMCRLEGTRFISDIDTSSLWEKVYKEYIDTHGEVSVDWKSNLFMDLAHSILGDNYSQHYKYRHMDLNHQVACLLAMKCETHSSTVKTVLIHRAQERTYHSMPSQTPEQKLLIPARHKKYFSENDQITNTTALEIISNKCLFRPKEIAIAINAFSQFLDVLASQKSSEDILAAFFEEVETLTIWNEQWKSVADQVTAESMPFRKIPSKLLRLVLSRNNGKLVALRVKIATMIKYGHGMEYTMQINEDGEVISLQIDDPTIDSITPVLSSSYNRLKTFALDATGDVSLALEKLISITDHQSELDTISIKIARRGQRMGSCGNAPWRTPQFSAKLLRSWIHCCLQKPSVHQIVLCLSPISIELFIEILVTFFSTSSIHEQTLTFDQMAYLSDTSTRATSSLYKDSQMSSSSNKSEAVPHHFDELCTQCKTIKFNACDLKLFTEPLFTLKYLKLKQLIIRKLSRPVRSIYYEADSKKDCSFFVSQLAQHPDFTMETLEIAEVDLGNVTSSDYDNLLKKKTLQTVRLVQCTGISIATIREIAALNIQVDCESSISKTIECTKTKDGLFTVTLTE